MVDRASERVQIRFNSEVTQTVHELMQAGRGEPRRAPVPGCPDCNGTGELIQKGERRYCSCRYEEYSL